MRLSLSHEIFRTALIALCIILEVSHGQSDCQPCGYTAISSATCTTILVEKNVQCNASIEHTASSVVVTDLVPGNTYSLRINCSGDCCANLTNPVSSILTVTHINSSSVYLNWTGPPVSADGTITKRPEVITNLSVTHITTSSVSLSWNKPLGISPYYRVAWGDGTKSLNLTTNETSTSIANLAPGTKYTFSVKTVAADNQTEGEPVEKSQNTSPAKPENITATQQDNSSLTLSWDPPQGHADSYEVNMSNTQLNVTQNHATRDEHYAFGGLLAGRIYSFTVTSVSGVLKNTSDIVQFATKPNPPGLLTITVRSNASMSLTWDRPLSTGGAYILFEVTSSSSQPLSTKVQNTTQTSIELLDLVSGTEYYIAVATVGPQGLKSTIVSHTQYTLPNAVKNLQANPESIDSIRLAWQDPVGFQSNYTYRVQINPQANKENVTVSKNSADINGLQPGTEYTCNVTTIAPANSSGPTESTRCYTKPKSVANLTADAIDTTVISLTWVKEDDHKNTYSYQVIVSAGGGQIRTMNLTSETIDVGDLTPGTSYTFRVITIANGVESEPKEAIRFTKLDKASNISAIGTTSNMTVIWSSPAGDATYIISIYQNNTLIQTLNKSTNEPVVFQNLRPGKTYNVTVSIHRGPVSAHSEVQNATYPNPPGPIEMEQQKNDSLAVSWVRPFDMDIGEYSFKVFSQNQSIDTLENSTSLVNLASGTLYSISVRTVGPMGYQSTAVTTSNYTRPNPVRRLQVNESTTDSVTVVWEQPNVAQIEVDYSYLVIVENPSGTQINQSIVTVTTAATGALHSGTKYNITVITQTADGTRASAESVTVFTKPYSIRNLSAIALNESAVHLNWSRPLQFQDGFSYRVEASQCTPSPKNQTVASEGALITSLTPGANCQFHVFSQVNGIEGAAVGISLYTRPSKAFPVVSNGGTNDSISVTWLSPPGNVGSYVINITSDIWGASQQLPDGARSHTFSNLAAGTVYTVTLTTVSGNSSETSDPVSNATYPNQPGAITVTDKTTGSIELEWGNAPNMTMGSFNYSVTYQTATTSSNERVTPNNSLLLDGLSSGTPYNISVATVGPMGFTSESVVVYLITTRPESVQSLEVTFVSTAVVELQWTAPGGYQSGYSYRVVTSSGGVVHEKKNITSNMATVSSLAPGTPYNFSVQALTPDATEGAAVTVSNCTVAAQVEDYTCHGPNRTSPVLVLSWINPTGCNQGFEIQLKTDPKETIPKCNSNCQHNFTGLSYNKEYTISLWTQGCGQKSEIKAISCKTGITVPPVPDAQTSVSVTETEYDKFTLKLESSLFNDTNGPIVYYGVLVTSAVEGSRGSRSSFDQYLTKTHDDWIAGKTTTYLAFVEKRPGANGGVFTVLIGEGNEWEGYKNGPLYAKGSYSFAVVTFTNLKLENELISISQSYFTISNFQDPITLPDNPVVIGGAIGGAIGGFLILLGITIVLAVVLKSKQSKEDSPGVPIHSIRAKASEPIKVEDYEAHYRKQRADSFCGFAEEFEDLKPVGIAQAKSSALAPENRGKNRYNNVLPYDSSRVKLSVHGSPFDDYINANYMPGYSSRKEFIAAQGPLPSTVDEFWRMIWEKNVHTLVMLTRCNEQGRVKCEEYWPSESRHFNNLTVTTTSEIPLEDWTIRDFDVKNVKTAESRSVRHFHFTAWPDHGVPETTELLINFRHLVREHMDQYSCHSPAVVHCSAGVGRTGTFIAIDRLLFQIEREGLVDVYGIIHDLRMHRPLMVQTEDQYVFLNQCAIDIIRSRTGTNVDLIYQNTAALSIYENFEPMKKSKNGYHKA